MTDMMAIAIFKQEPNIASSIVVLKFFRTNFYYSMMDIMAIAIFKI
jgi:hypothetical protein